MSLIEIEGLAKSYRVYQKQEGLWASLRGLVHREYREVNAVRGIDLRVEQGEFVAFLGPNGAGKTTTLKLLSGVINLSAGTARDGACAVEARKLVPAALRTGHGAEESAQVGFCRRWNRFGCNCRFIGSSPGHSPDDRFVLEKRLATTPDSIHGGDEGRAANAHSERIVH